MTTMQVPQFLRRVSSIAILSASAFFSVHGADEWIRVMSLEEFPPSYTESYEVMIVADRTPLAMTDQAYVAYQDRSLLSSEIELSEDGSRIVNTGDAYVFRLMNLTVTSPVFQIYGSEDDARKLNADSEEFLCFSNVFQGINWVIYGSDGVFTVKNSDVKKYNTLFCSKTSGRFNLTDKSDETTDMRFYMRHDNSGSEPDPIEPEIPDVPSVSYDRDITLCSDGAVSLYGLTELQATLSVEKNCYISYRIGDETEFAPYQAPINVRQAGDLSFFARNSAGAHSDTVTVTFAGALASTQTEWLRANNLSDLPTADGESAEVIIVSDNFPEALTTIARKNGSYDTLDGTSVVLADDGGSIIDSGSAYIFTLEQFASQYTINGTGSDSDSHIAITKSENLVFSSDASDHYQWRINQYSDGVFVIKNVTSNTKYPTLAYYGDDAKRLFDLSSDPNQLNHLRLYVKHQLVIDTVRPPLPQLTYSRKVTSYDTGEIKLDRQDELSVALRLPGHEIFYRFTAESDGRRRANTEEEYSLYRQPIQITSSGTLKYYAVSADGRQGETGSARFVLDNTTDSSICIASELTEAPFVYDLQGRRITAPMRPGIYIINGQKTFIH